MGPVEAAPARKPNDYASDQEVRWCPGCGDYAILSQTKKALSIAGIDPERIVFVSGIGCSSRFPYYMSTYGIHGIHGRAPAIASGLKIARPELAVWVATGDGDGLSIGGNHMIHAIRRNLDIKILLFNNRIYGLTKGQVSPTSEFGKKTVTTPHGSVDSPLGPCAIAIGCEATFVARTVDMNPKHMVGIIERAAAHKGTAFVEIYQNCNIFNDGAFRYATDRAVRADHTLELEHGKPLIFGQNRDKGIRLASGYEPEVVTIGQNGITEADLLVHDEKAPSPALAFLLTRLRHPAFPEPIGVFRDIQASTYEALVHEQIEEVRKKKGEPDLQALLVGPDPWTVE